MRVPHDHAWERLLHRRLRAGDDEALAAAYDEFAPYVYGIAVRATGDERAAEEITEHVFLRLWERPGEFDPDRGPLRVLLCELARTRAIDRLRQVGRHQAVRSALDWEPVEGTPPTGPPAAKTVRDVLLGLPADQRNAIMLAYLHGLSFREVATELAIPEGAARSGIYSGLRRLAVALAAAGVTPRGPRSA
ncbi:MAG TPA: sigma-70 family RNA polymerase sigma factor [Streptosporangiaceae bacterium]|nr:sigma-70 family RNA polymerase sigma factor [Streptosporangiaceae bacterium]